MSYVNGFLVPVKKDRIEDYVALSQKMRAFCEAEGATEYVEATGDGLTPGEVTSFMRAVQCEDDEVVVFSWITYPSKAVCDAANAKMMSHPDFQMQGDLPFDGKRMVFGGFSPIVEWSRTA